MIIFECNSEVLMNSKLKVYSSKKVNFKTQMIKLDFPPSGFRKVFFI